MGRRAQFASHAPPLLARAAGWRCKMSSHLQCQVALLQRAVGQKSLHTPPASMAASSSAKSDLTSMRPSASNLLFQAEKKKETYPKQVVCYIKQATCFPKHAARGLPKPCFEWLRTVRLRKAHQHWCLLKHKVSSQILTMI